MIRIIDFAAPLGQKAGPGQWNDLDMRKPPLRSTFHLEQSYDGIHSTGWVGSIASTPCCHFLIYAPDRDVGTVG